MKAYFVSIGDTHESAFDSQKRTINISDNYVDPALASKIGGHCQIYLDVYSSQDFVAAYNSNLPVIFAVTVAVLFLIMAVVFFVYDRFVKYRNDKVLGVAARSNAIVSQLFPSAVRDQLFEAKAEEKRQLLNNRNTLKGFLSGDGKTLSSDESDPEDLFKSQPIADLYPETTVMFADIVGTKSCFVKACVCCNGNGDSRLTHFVASLNLGFTAWSSVREPGQVFRLLETVYHSFDEIARRRRVFKVETVGDCYVAVAGLPEPRRDQ